MKDEFQRKIISELARLNSNMYFLVSVDGKEVKRAKGVKGALLKIQDLENLLIFYLIEQW